MTPKTKTEKNIVALSNKLPRITLKQHKQAFTNCFEKNAVQSRKTMFCLECGHEWRLNSIQKEKTATCTRCRKKLTVIENYKNGLRETAYYQQITTVESLQIVRMVCITKTMRKNTASTFFAHEVMQIFIDEKGKVKTISKNVMGLSQYFDQWIIGSKLSLKAKVDTRRFYLRPAYVLPNLKTLPILNRNGFDGSFHGIQPQVFIKQILTDNIAETLLKTNQTALLKFHITDTPIKTNGKYWAAIKICNRNNYIIEDASLWIDYVDLLEHFHKDLRSAKYLCPNNLTFAHDKLMTKKNRKLIRQTFEEKKKQIAKNQKEYFKEKKHFFGLVFSENNISINVIESVKEFLKEGCTHNHCVFTNEYYKKQNALILTAKVDGVRTETVQVSLENFEILQSRGRGNKTSRYNRQIINLVEKNLHQIRARIKVAS